MYSNTLRKWKKDLAYYSARYKREKKNDSPENLDWTPNLDLSNLWVTRQRIVTEILNCLKEAFSWNVSDIGDIRDFEMEIELTDKVPVSEL